MSDVATLRRLRAQAGARTRVDVPAPQPQPAPAAAVPNVADPALRRLLLATLARRQPASRSAPARLAADRTLPGQELAPGLHYLERSPGLTAPPHATGVPADAMAPAADLLPLPVLGARNITAPAARADLLFFDTETTGLAGGTGTRAFMIGAADWPGGRLRVRQLWISTLGAEAAMLEAFRAWLQPDTLLVSYNGRCYDAPLLATRYRLARLRNPLDGLPHLDLLHAVRRRYRGAWENCRLATVERRLLDIVRDDDLPGSEAPRAFLDFLRGGPATDLRRVLVHNHQDVVTLARLLERLLVIGR